MVATVALGGEPFDSTLHLTRGSDFSVTLRTETGDWPATAVIAIEVAGQTWTAVLDGSDAVFTVDQVSVDTAIAANPNYNRIWYTDGATRMLFGYGGVKVHG